MKDQEDITFFLGVLATILDLVMQAASILDIFFGWIGELFASAQ